MEAAGIKRDSIAYPQVVKGGPEVPQRRSGHDRERQACLIGVSVEGPRQGDIAFAEGSRQLRPHGPCDHGHNWKLTRVSVRSVEKLVTATDPSTEAISKVKPWMLMAWASGRATKPKAGAASSLILANLASKNPMGSQGLFLRKSKPYTMVPKVRLNR